MTLRNRSNDFISNGLTIPQEEVLGESIMMIPDSQRRFGEAMKKLSDLLVRDRSLPHVSDPSLTFSQEEGSGVYDENDETIREAQKLRAEFYPLESETKESPALETFDETKEEMF